MDLDLFQTTKPCISWGTSHWAPLIALVIIAILCVSFAKRFLSKKHQKRLLLALSVIPLLCYLTYLTIQIATGAFRIQNDLPVHLCRFIALMGPYVYWKENKLWTGIFYFWIIVGTFNALIAVDLKYDIPHWSYLLYFTMHGTLILLPVYYCLVMGHRVRRKDLWNAFWATNVFLVVAFIVNFAIGSNYFYVAHKPDVASLLDYLGPWPWYIVAIEFIALILFYVAYLPFSFSSKKVTCQGVLRSSPLEFP